MLNKTEREERDRRVLGMFIAGGSEREIGRAVGLSGPRIHQILHRQLERTASDLELRSREALTVHIARMEQLLKACWPAALKGDLKAIEQARKVLLAQAKLFGLEHRRDPVPIAEELEEDDEDDDLDELARFRGRRQSEDW